MQEKIGREINPHNFTIVEFKKRVKEKDHFVKSILNEEVRVIVGNLDELLNS